ncbi:MAG: isoprenylcysteine carboxylmethyltransferase family protein [Gammaproteobacteria bacterium]|nr:isoprenylcysteine carboxylmethyltransferase family protein [Gammaproteobacteria bacterium]
MSLTDHFRRAPDSARILAPPPLIVSVTIAAGLLCGHYWPLDWPGFADEMVWPGRLLALLAAGLVAWAALSFRTARTTINPFQSTTRLVDSGPYRFTRNPMYLSLLSLQAGLAGILAEPWLLAWLAPAWAVLRYGVIAREEKYLSSKFGADYDSYRQRVRRWI